MFDAKTEPCEDWDLWIRIAKYYEFECIPDVLVKIHFHGPQISRDPAKHIPAREAILGKYFNEISRYPKILSTHLRYLAILYSSAGNYTKARKYVLKAIKIYPLCLPNKLTWDILVRIIIGKRVYFFLKNLKREFYESFIFLIQKS